MVSELDAFLMYVGIVFAGAILAQVVVYPERVRDLWRALRR